MSIFSPVEGSLEGGTRLHFTGSAFDLSDPTKNKIEIDGLPCNMLDFLTTTTYMSCITPPAASTAMLDPILGYYTAMITFESGIIPVYWR